MVRFSAKQTPRKYLFLVVFLAITVVFFVVDYLSAYSDSTFNIARSLEFIKSGGVVKDRIALALKYNATYADIPAPTLEWEEMPAAPVGRLDGYSAQIGNLLYVFAGFASLDHVHSHVDVFNFSDNTWGGRFDMPKEMANSHLGIANDGRYIYIISGQYGPQCRPPTSRSFVLDTKTREWHDFISLPFPRYAPPTQLWRGRLHVMGGGKEDRYEPALEHWSIAVKDGKALEREWRSELPIPRGGPHRACIVANDRLIVLGDKKAILCQSLDLLFSNAHEESRLFTVMSTCLKVMGQSGKNWLPCQSQILILKRLGLWSTTR